MCTARQLLHTLSAERALCAVLIPIGDTVSIAFIAYATRIDMLHVICGCSCWSVHLSLMVSPDRGESSSAPAAAVAAAVGYQAIPFGQIHLASTVKPRLCCFQDHPGSCGKNTKLSDNYIRHFKSTAISAVSHTYLLR